MTVFLTIGILGNLSAQMKLFQGSFDEALKKAKEEKKDLFVDFYAEWCAPCKAMEAQVFTQAEVGAYFNEKFVCVQVNVEDAKNKEVSKKYNVTALPTMLFINRDGKELRRVQGAVGPDVLLHEGKIATGDALSFEQLYEKYKKNKKDLETQQQLLLEAPGFIPTQEKYNQQKWSVRVESIFSDYLKNKKIDHMDNPTDFMLLTLYYGASAKDDPVFDYIAKNYRKFVQNVGKEQVAQYLIGINNSYIIQLCKKGNLDYKKQIERVNGDLKEAYEGISFGSLSVEEAITLLADATYSLYKRDENTFFEKMNAYFAGKEDLVEFEDYSQPLEDLATVYEGKMSPNAYNKCITWIARALEFEIPVETRTQLLMMMGDCLKNTGNKEKAKQSYNQAFLASAGIEDKVLMKQLQQIIQETLQSL